MDKIKVVFPEIKYAIVFLDHDEGKSIRVKPFMDTFDKRIILSSYFESVETDAVERYIENEAGLMLATLDRMTNIDYEAIEIDKLVSSGLWYKIKGAIINFAELQRDIEKISQHKNLEGKLNQMIDKVGLFIDNISKLDWSPEGVQSLAKEIVPQLQQLAQVFPNIENKAPISEKKSKKSSEKTQSTP
jgi:hypothetical protein